MPPVVAAIGTFGATIAASFGATIAATSITAFVIGAGTLVLAAAGLKKPKLDPQRGRASTGRSVMIRSTDEPRQIAFGEVMVAGAITYSNSSDEELRELYIEQVLTGHEIDSFIGFQVDDAYIPFADIDDINASPAGNGEIDADTNSHGFGPVDGTPVLYMRGHLGTAAQAVDVQLNTEFTEIGSTHRHRGCARLNLRANLLEGSEDVWQSGPPRNVAAVIRGMKIYDPREDGTRGFSPDGGQRVDDESTWTYSDNVALAWGTYRINSDLGPGWATSRIDWASVATAADVCDALVEIPPAASPANTEKRYRIALVAHTSQEPAEIIEDILSAMNGAERMIGDVWHVFADTYPTADFALTESDLVGPIEYRKQPEIGERFNQVRGVYYDPDRNHKLSQFLTVNDTTLRAARDNGRVLHRDLRLEGVPGEYQAQRIAWRQVTRADNTGLLVFPANYSSVGIRPGDTGTVTLAELGFSAKTFRVLRTEYIDFQGVELTLIEDNSADYADPTVGQYGTRTAAGAITFPTLLPDRTPSASMIQDPTFIRTLSLWDGVLFANARNYAWLEENQGSATTTIERTGGIHGGLMRLQVTGGGSDRASVTSIARPSAAVITGETLRCTVRMRKVNTPSPGPTTGRINIAIGTGNLYSNGGIQYSVGLGLDLTIAQINAWAEGAWQEFEFTQITTNASPPDAPFAMVQFDLATAGFKFDTAFEIELDTLNLTPVKT